MPINSEHLADLANATVVDHHGQKVGTVGQVYQDDRTGQPAWASVKGGLFGLRESLVPLHEGDWVDGQIQVPYSKDVIKGAPHPDIEQHLDDEQQNALSDYYGLPRPAMDRGADAPRPDTDPATDVPTAGDADPVTTHRSEEAAESLTESRVEGVPASVTQSGQRSDLTSESVTEADSSMTDLDRADTEAAPVRRAEEPERPVSEAEEADPAAEDKREPGPMDADWDETRHARYQQENPAAQHDWSAEQAPEEPVSTTWSVPSTDPADEEPTRVSRSGYADDRPAAHAAAYEGHHRPTGDEAAETPSAAEAAAEVADPSAEVPRGRHAEGAGTPMIDERTDEAAVYTADADARRSRTAEGSSSDGTGEGEPSGRASDDPAVEGVFDQPGATLDPGGAPAGVAASDTATTAYEVPGQEVGAPITSARPEDEFDVDREVPFDADTAPEEPAQQGALEEGAEPTDHQADGPGPGHPADRDGTDMTDEERERLNRARGAL